MGCGQGSEKSEFRVQECVCPSARNCSAHSMLQDKTNNGVQMPRLRALSKVHVHGGSCDRQLQVLVVTVTETGLSVDRGTAAGEQFERL